jgi:hypothetical protein
MKLKSLLVGAAMAFAAATTASATTYVYVGSWTVADGPPVAPVWTSNPPVYSGLTAAAHLFGGSPSRYAISTVDSNPADINFMAHVDGWSDPQYLTGAGVPEGYSLDTGGGGYNSNPGYQSAYSAYVFDHACGVYYCSAGGGESATNYAFRAVPEPATWAVMLIGVAGLGAVLRNRRKLAEI